MELSLVKAEKTESPDVMMKEEKGSLGNTTLAVAEPNSAAFQLTNPRRRRHLPLPPPPPRISSTIVSGEHTVPSVTSPTTAELIKSFCETSPRPVSSSSSSEEQEQEQTTSSHHHSRVKSRSLSPSSPFDCHDDEEEIKKECENVPNKKICKRKSAKDVIEFVSSELKTREDSVERYKKKFNDLCKHYDQKKADKQKLQDHVKSLQDEIKKLKDEKEAANVVLNIKQMADNAQKIIYDMQTAKLANLAKENLELKQTTDNQQETIGQLQKRVENLENAMKDDVHDLNMAISAFNLFMAKTKKRAVDIFGDIQEKKADSTDNLTTSSSDETAKSREGNGEGVVLNTNQSHPSSVSATVVVASKETGFSGIKMERMSPKRKKRKEIEDDDNNSDHHAAILISPTNSSSQHTNDCFKNKKQRCE